MGGSAADRDHLSPQPVKADPCVPAVLLLHSSHVLHHLVNSHLYHLYRFYR